MVEFKWLIPVYKGESAFLLLEIESLSDFKCLFSALISLKRISKNKDYFQGKLWIKAEEIYFQLF
jgi:hypothetical protein